MNTLSDSVNIKKAVNDSRWNQIRSIMDIIAILDTINTHRRIVLAQARHPNILDIAVNLRRIAEEAEWMEAEIAKIQGRLHQLQGVVEKDIENDHREEAEETRLYQMQEILLKAINNNQGRVEEVATNGKNQNQTVRFPRRKLRRNKAKRVVYSSRKRKV